MISSELAVRLKQAGLEWRPAERDFFMSADEAMQFGLIDRVIKKREDAPATETMR